MKPKLLLFLLFTIPLVFAQQVPILPAVYKGYINSACNVNGAKLQAYINNELRGETTVYCQNNICWYGSIKGLQYADLAVSGKSEENNTTLIEFYLSINGNKVKISKSDTFISGQVKVLNFSITQEQCDILFPHGGRSFMEETLQNKTQTTSEIVRVLEQEGIRNVVENFISLENINNVEIRKISSIEINLSEIQKIVKKPNTNQTLEDIINKIKKLLEFYLHKKVKKKVRIEIRPTKARLNIKIIKITTNIGNVIYFTKIEKEINENNIIEYFPKELAQTSDNVTWIKGKIIRILERDPVFEVSPEDGKIAYLVEGNKTEEAKEAITLTYSYSIVEEEEKEKPGSVNETPLIQPPVQPEKTNVTQNKTTTTYPEESKPATNVWVIIAVIVAIVLGLGVVYYKVRGSPKA